MTLARFEQLRRAHRLLELAELKANNGDHFAAAGKVIEARVLIYGIEQQASPAQPKVAGVSNTGSSGAKPYYSIGVTQPAAGSRNPGNY